MQQIPRQPGSGPIKEQIPLLNLEQDEKKHEKSRQNSSDQGKVFSSEKLFYVYVVLFASIQKKSCQLRRTAVGFPKRIGSILTAVYKHFSAAGSIVSFRHFWFSFVFFSFSLRKAIIEIPFQSVIITYSRPATFCCRVTPRAATGRPWFGRGPILLVIWYCAQKELAIRGRSCYKRCSNFLYK